MQESSKLRRYEDGFAHWCPGCGEMHLLPDRWKFDGNLDSPTFTPSFKHRGLRREFIDGQWTGKWLKDADGKTVSYICHYILTKGILNFCGDCTHSLKGMSLPLPMIPDEEFQ